MRKMSKKFFIIIKNFELNVDDDEFEQERLKKKRKLMKIT